MVAVTQKYLEGLFDELEKIGQIGQASAPGTPPTVASSGGPGMSSPPPSSAMPAPPTAGELGAGKMSAKDLGVSSANPMGGGGSGGGAPPPPPMSPIPTSSTSGPAAGSLLSSQRQKGFGTGTLSRADSSATAAPSASEFGG